MMNHKAEISLHSEGCTDTGASDLFSLKFKGSRYNTLFWYDLPTENSKLRTVTEQLPIYYIVSRTVGLVLFPSSPVPLPTLMDEAHIPAEPILSEAPYLLWGSIFTEKQTVQVEFKVAVCTL